MDSGFIYSKTSEEILFHIKWLMELFHLSQNLSPKFYRNVVGGTILFVTKLLRESRNFYYKCRETMGMISSAGCFPAPQAPDAFRHLPQPPDAFFPAPTSSAGCFPTPQAEFP